MKEKILVVDDRESLADSIADFLKGDTAYGVEEAIIKLQTRTYTELILDHDLGGGRTGLEIMEWIKANNIEIKIYANSGSYEGTEALVKAGATIHPEKSIKSRGI